jgi:hypothetical protein
MNAQPKPHVSQDELLEILELQDAARSILMVAERMSTAITLRLANGEGIEAGELYMDSPGREVRRYGSTNK